MAGVEHDPKPRPKFVAPNTVRYFRAGTEVIRLHGTDIVVKHADGSETWSSGGWRTLTTKGRIEAFSKVPVRLIQHKREWFIVPAENPWGAPKDTLFADGVHIDRNGVVTGAAKAPDKSLVKRIDAYAKAFSEALPVAPPSGGDYWGCYFRDSKTGAPAMGTDHLLSHISDDERYFVPSLLHRVMESHHPGQAWFHAAFGKDEFRLLEPSRGKNYGRSQFKKWIKDYLVAVLVHGRPA